jgi:hypothetical protein
MTACAYQLVLHSQTGLKGGINMRLHQSNQEPVSYILQIENAEGLSTFDLLMFPEGHFSLGT